MDIIETSLETRKQKIREFTRENLYDFLTYPFTIDRFVPAMLGMIVLGLILGLTVSLLIGTAELKGAWLYPVYLFLYALIFFLDVLAPKENEWSERDDEL